MPTMKPLTLKVLRQLAAGGFYSGQALAGELGVTRAAVWQALDGVADLGIDLYRVRGRGYALAEPIEFLDKQRLIAELGADQFSIEIADCLQSTNTGLMERAAQGAPHGTCLVAELQTHGRGRRGRSWLSSLGGGLTFSLLWRFQQGAGQLSGLSLVAGLAVARALERLGIAGVKLKWPNDVLHHHCKLAGLLVEAHGDVLGPSFAVIGIGVNYKLSPAVMAGIDQAVTDVASIAQPAPGRNTLLIALLQELGAVLRGFERDGFADFAPEWESRHAYHGKPVSLRLPNGQTISGVVSGVGEDGSLRLTAASGTMRFNVGEISLRASA